MRFAGAFAVFFATSTTALACDAPPEDGFAGNAPLEAPLIARGIVHAVEDVVCLADIGGGVPIEHNCTARLLVEPIESYAGSRHPVHREEGDITVLMPFATGGYSVAAGDAAPRIAAGLVNDVVFIAEGPAQGPGFARPEFRVRAGECLHTSVRSRDDPMIATWVENGRLTPIPADATASDR